MSLLGALLTTAVATVVGLPAGLVAGYHGRRTDAVLSWLFNVLMSVPVVIIVLVVVAAVGVGVVPTMTTMGVLMSPLVYRLTRATTLNVRGELYVDAAKVAGLRDTRIIGRHVLRSVRTPLIIQLAQIAGIAILIQSGIEFLGLGDSSVPSWGASLSEAFSNIYRSPWMIVPPGVAITLLVAALAVLGSALTDALNDGGTRRAPGRALRFARAVAGSAPQHGSAEGALLAVSGLDVSHTRAVGEPISVVAGVSLEVRPGEIVGLIGESGSGKSQTSFALLGLLPTSASVTADSLTVAGRDVLAMSEAERRELLGTSLGYIPQEPMSNLAPAFTIATQLVDPMRAHLGISAKEARRRAGELLRRVGIADPDRVLRSYPHQLSGGMAQRVLIAGALSCEPAVLVADEPTTALDVTVQAEVLDLLRGLVAERGLGVLLVTHDLGVVADVCDRVSVMRAGRIVESAGVRELFADPQHPYTRQLLGATLDGGQSRADLDRAVEASPLTQEQR